MKRIATMSPGHAFVLAWPVLVLILLFVVELTGLRGRWIERLKASPRMALLVALAACIFFPLIYRGATNVEFIYFQF